MGCSGDAYRCSIIEGGGDVTLGKCAGTHPKGSICYIYLFLVISIMCVWAKSNINGTIAWMKKRFKPGF